MVRQEEGYSIHIDMDNPPTKAKPSGEAPSMVPDRK
jgi:hypothetical protein